MWSRQPVSTTHGFAIVDSSARISVVWSHKSVQVSVAEKCLHFSMTERRRGHRRRQRCAGICRIPCASVMPIGKQVCPGHDIRLSGIFLGSLPSPSRPRVPFRVSSGASPVPCSWLRVPRRTPCGCAVPRDSSAGCVPCGTRLPTCRPYLALFRVPWLSDLRTFAESPTPRSCPTTSKLVSVAILGLLTFRLSGPA